MLSREHILAEIRRTAAEHDGRPPGRQRFAAETGIRETDWAGRHWARWNDALHEAGFPPNKRQGRYDDEYVFSKLIPEVRLLGRLPTTAEFRLRRRRGDGFPSYGVFAKFGRKRDLAAKLADYCRQRDDCADVLDLLGPLLAEKRVFDDDSAPESAFGFVYLLKSGRYYKLGRTNALGRREYELGIQLPEPAARIHAIRTDDPPGIERYWHSRFSDRRKNGEWFELTSADVKAFRRRKFM